MALSRYRHTHRKKDVSRRLRPHFSRGGAVLPQDCQKQPRQAFESAPTGHLTLPERLKRESQLPGSGGPPRGNLTAHGSVGVRWGRDGGGERHGANGQKPPISLTYHQGAGSPSS